MASTLHDKLQQLGDLELAILVALISEEHCILSSSSNSTENLKEELHLVCSELFGLQVATIDCSAQTNVDEFSEAILVDVADEDDHDSFDREIGSRTQSAVPGSDRFGGVNNTLDNRRIADVIIAKNIDLASPNVQVQTLELLRTKRIFTRTAMHLAPKSLLFVAVVSKPEARLTHHLNDMFAMSHFHDADLGFSRTEDRFEGQHSTNGFHQNEVKSLRVQARNVHITAEMAGYLHNVVIFMRLSRYVKSGVTATATRNLRTLAKTLASLHGLEFLTPSLVALAARKIYPHRLVLATSETERSLQWGSDPEAVRQMMDGLTVELVIEEVIASVESPL
ncbi:Hypothetical protein R9X50_00232600 [Acrodontium crateriforme]|uniref:Magnesium chelatase n=1 Tax=Acrodontium crateriforme TaxID=150365 RepID=A0AAQ3M209_9PEZI|nr:Hypothetical protein R9X50_00232600 [Acrodontium crateriforme]